MMKICTQCKLNQTENHFEKWRNVCKNCRLQYKIQYIKKQSFQPDLTIQELKCYRCQMVKSIDQYGLNKRKPKGYDRICKPCTKEKSQIYYLQYKDKIKQQVLKYYELNREDIIQKQLIKQRERYKTDKIFVLKRRLRNRIYYALKNKGWSKLNKLNEYLGCDYLYLVKHLEQQFLPNMSWDNYGDWHIDHIIPLDSANSSEELHKLCHYSNLQPLWSKDNFSKGSKL